ncbi:hypothetical protein NDU88_003385 [Pleurodeles waltl]|uniref:Uncharacterized protein n=1 Tax=Pleurodeles waltl TaxID=8319 RepID=A0AAV7WNX9_PLEWA|nr:hypothetical protein NDU88_003385 [Pleurodeles waltl]
MPTVPTFPFHPDLCVPLLSSHQSDSGFRFPVPVIRPQQQQPRTQRRPSVFNPPTSDLLGLDTQPCRCRQCTRHRTRRATGVGAATATPLQTPAEAARSWVWLAGGIGVEGSAIQGKARTLGTRKLSHYPGCGHRHDPPVRGR